MGARIAVRVAVLAIVLSACGDGSDSSSMPSGTEATTSVAPDTSVTTTAPGPSTTGQAPPRVTLPPSGPRGRVDPPRTEAYRLLTTGGDGCRQLFAAVEGWKIATQSEVGVPENLYYLYKAAAEACLLRWAEARADFDRLLRVDPNPTFPTTCTAEGTCERCHRLVFEWLRGQLEAYRRDPSYAPVIEKSSAASPCPTTTTSPSTSSSTTRATTTSTTLRR